MSLLRWCWSDLVNLTCIRNRLNPYNSLWRVVHGPKDVTPSEELVAIAAASAAAAAAHTTQMSQGHQGQAGQLAQQPSITSLQQDQHQQQDGRICPAQPEAEAISKLTRLQPTQVCPCYAAQPDFCYSDSRRQ